MSIEIHVFMRDSMVPDRNAWQQMVEQLGFPLVLDPTLNLRDDTGYVPVEYQGKESGFEFSLEPAADTLDLYPEVTTRIQHRDQCATFGWTSDLIECAAAISAAAALTVMCDGIYFSPDDELVLASDTVVAEIRRELDGFA